MPHRNRVDPWGVPHAVPARGTWMGNRGGRIHDVDGQIVAAQASRAWIVCVLEFHGRSRTVMGDGYTELFFLDEATALAAGHRPCFECRRADATRFLDLHRRVSGATAARAPDLDRSLSAERRVARSGVDAGKLAVRRRVATLPDAAVVDIDDTAWLVLGDELLRWSHDGYTTRRGVSGDALGWVLTPPTTLRVLAAGYRPVLHPTATRRRQRP